MKSNNNEGHRAAKEIMCSKRDNESNYNKL